jgi:tetratricopeptide (TPR) repeat protein
MRDAFGRARAAADRAVLLDSTLADGYAALAEIKLYAKPEWDWDGAARAFERALSLNPSLGDTRVHYGRYYVLIGRPGDALAQMRRAREVDPLSPVLAAALAQVYWAYGMYEDALTEARAAVELSPAFPLGLYMLGAIYASQGKYDEAIAAHGRAGAAAAEWRWGLGHAYALAGRRDAARRVLAGLERERRPWNSWGIAEIHTALGDTDAALRWLGVAYDQGHPHIPWLHRNPNFAPLRPDPRFTALRQKLQVPS